MVDFFSGSGGGGGAANVGGEQEEKEAAPGATPGAAPGAGGDAAAGGFASSITGGTSRFLGKMWDSKNGLMDTVSSYLPKKPSVDDPTAGPGPTEGGGEPGIDRPKRRPPGRPARTRSDSEDSSEPEYDDGTRNIDRLQLSDQENLDDKDLDDYSRECKDFMIKLVDMLFNNPADITQEMKSKHGEYCKTESGRLWFARQVNAKRTTSQKVTETTFFGLQQYFALVLMECQQDEDFTPAKILMNMCFTFYHEVQPKFGILGKPHKVFLYSYLKEQTIWTSLRFWNAAFFDAVQKERYRPTVTSSDQKRDEKQTQENIVFGQLGTFLCNMQSFGLSKELCTEFLRKQSTIANLKPEQVQMLKENIDRGQTSMGDSKSDMSWMPSLPELPSMPSVPSISKPNMPNMPTFSKPSMPSMPSMPKPSMPNIPNPMARFMNKGNSEAAAPAAPSGEDPAPP